MEKCRQVYDVVGCYAVAGTEQGGGDLGTAGAKEGGEAGRVIEGHDGVVVAVEQEYVSTGEGGGGGGLIEHEHGAEQGGSGERNFGVELKERGADVGAVGEAQREKGALGGGGEVVVEQGGLDERGELGGAGDHLGGVEATFAQAGEEPVGTLFRDEAARGEQGGTGGDAVGERHKIVFVAPGAVEKQQGGGGGGSRGRAEKVRPGGWVHASKTENGRRGAARALDGGGAAPAQAGEGGQSDQDELDGGENFQG